MKRKIGIGLMILGAVGLVCTRLFETGIIIQMGIHMHTWITIAAIALLPAGLIVTITGIIPAIRARKAAKAEAERLEAERRAAAMPILSYTATEYDPVTIRQMLESLAGQRPDLDLTRCYKQMEDMDKCQERLHKLLKVNDAAYLRDTIGLLNDVEQYICKNFRKIINRGIVDDDTFAYGDNNQTYPELIDAVVGENQTELDNLGRFLVDLADMISRKNENHQTELEAWMKVIRDPMKK